MGPTKIAKQLNTESVPTPTLYFKEHGMPYNTKKKINTKWDGQSVIYILENMVYLGHTVNFKTTTKSYKSHKTVELPKENWLIFENTHPAIVEQAVWDKVQELRKNKRRNTKSGKTSIFSGVLRCADCGAKLYFCTSKSFESKQDHFVCSNYKGNTGNCTAHFIREEILYELVLTQIQIMLSYMQQFENDFVKSLMDKASSENKKELSAKKKKIEQNQKRISELDSIFKRIYEDNISGKLSDERFVKLSKDYESEQKALQNETIMLEAELSQSEKNISNVEYFLKIVRQYTRIDELSARVVNDLIDRIEIHAPVKENGQRVQQIDIYYTAVGVIDIPEYFQESAI